MVTGLYLDETLLIAWADDVLGLRSLLITRVVTVVELPNNSKPPGKKKETAIMKKVTADRKVTAGMKGNRW